MSFMIPNILFPFAYLCPLKQIRECDLEARLIVASGHKALVYKHCIVSLLLHFQFTKFDVWYPMSLWTWPSIIPEDTYVIPTLSVS